MMFPEELDMAVFVHKEDLEGGHSMPVHIIINIIH